MAIITSKFQVSMIILNWIIVKWQNQVYQYIVNELIFLDFTDFSPFYGNHEGNNKIGSFVQQQYPKCFRNASIEARFPVENP